MSGTLPSRFPVRTFKPRRRPLSTSRAALLDRLAPRWCLAETGSRLDPVEVFGRSAPVVLDVGIGLGDALTSAAAVEGDVDVIGVDVHTPGIAASLSRIDELGLGNVRLVHGDVLVFLDRLRESSLAGIRIYFPDPWPKARHRQRRLVTPDNVARLTASLAIGGWIHLATDVDDYATQMVRTLGAHPDLVGGFVDRPLERPVTRYERKGLAAGRRVADLVYRRCDPAVERLAGASTGRSARRLAVPPTATDERL